MLTTAREVRARRIVIDSLSDLQLAAAEPIRFMDVSSIVLARYRDDGALHRTIHVAKTRASSNDPGVRELAIHGDGARIGGRVGPG